MIIDGCTESLKKAVPREKRAWVRLVVDIKGIVGKIKGIRELSQQG
jgi:hypothetical protein